VASEAPRGVGELRRGKEMNGMILYPTDDEIWALNVAILREEYHRYANPLFDRWDERKFFLAVVKICKLPKPLKINESALG
jgi:hypothetical protein